jgi:hypothetical protein
MDAVARSEENGQSIGRICADFQSARHHFVSTRATITVFAPLGRDLSFL